MSGSSVAQPSPWALVDRAAPRVMIVDDEPTTIEVLEVLLQGQGYTELITTTHPGQVLDLLTGNRPDVLLLNLLMPEVGGLDILAAMRRDPALAGIPVIILTSSGDPETKLAALEAGAHDFLAKPVDPSELALRIRNALALQALRADPEGRRRTQPATPLVRPSSTAAVPGPDRAATTVANRAGRAGTPLVSRLAAQSPRLAAIADRFVGRLEAKLAEMEASHRAGDFAALADLAHWLRGAAGTVGFDAFTGPAEALRTAARQGNADEVAASLREIRALAARIGPSAHR